MAGASPRVKAVAEPKRIRYAIAIDANHRVTVNTRAGLSRRVLALAAVSLLVAGSPGCAPVFAAPQYGGSRGSPSSGWLYRGARLPEYGRGFTVYRTEAQTGQLWGTSRLVTMVRRAARAMLRDGATVPLRVADLSGPRGGNVARHHSHRNGRDVDLLFFAKNAETGLPVLTPGFVRYDPHGESRFVTPRLRFDTARNWSLVAAVLQDPDVAVMRMFCAVWIRQMLLDYAHSIGAPAALIARAQRVLAQPGDSAPHDDHFHVRIACTPAERAQGCIDGGPLWAWLEKDWEKSDALPGDDDSILALMEPLPPGVLFGPPASLASFTSTPAAPFCAVQQSLAKPGEDYGVCLPSGPDSTGEASPSGVQRDQGVQPLVPQPVNPALVQSNLNG